MKLLTLPESENVQQNYVLIYPVISKSRSPVRSYVFINIFF